MTHQVALYLFIFFKMALTVFKLKTTNSYDQGADAQIASNSLDVAQGTLLSLSWGFAVAAGVGTTIIGVSKDQKTFASDNQTVAMKKVNFHPTKPEDDYIATITGGTITQAKVGNYYDLNAAQVVNGATESSTTGQVQLVEFISATRGIFRIVNL